MHEGGEILYRTGLWYTLTFITTDSDTNLSKAGQPQLALNCSKIVPVSAPQMYIKDRISAAPVLLMNCQYLGLRRIQRRRAP